MNWEQIESIEAILITHDETIEDLRKQTIQAIENVLNERAKS